VVQMPALHCYERKPMKPRTTTASTVLAVATTVATLATALEGSATADDTQDGRSAQQAKTDSLDGTRVFALVIYGAGDLLAPIGISSATRVRGQIGARLLFPSSLSIALYFNATDLSREFRSAKASDFGANMISTELGPYSFGADVKYSGLGGVFGGQSYFRASAYDWTKTGAEGASYSAVPYAAGIGPLLAYRVDPDKFLKNTFYIDGSIGFALRGVGGDVASQARMAQFVGRDVTAVVGGEIRASMEFNALRALASISYFPIGDLDGVSNVRLNLSVGVVGDALRFSPPK
jgi:hypothetical protein